MQQSYDVLFASSNKNKFLEAQAILEQHDVSLGFYRSNMTEVQSDKLDEIATKKADDAFAQCKKPVIIEDDGLFIDALGGFPGPYSSYVFETIGNGGILDLLRSKRTASFRSVIAYRDSTNSMLFRGILHGRISKNPRGDGWGYDPIFIPTQSSKTFAELEDKNTISHRHVALKKFVSWFLHKR